MDRVAALRAPDCWICRMSSPDVSFAKPDSFPKTVDVAIIGGGVVGVATALELARRGVTVAVLERGRVGYGCSYGNAGWLTPSLSVPLPAPGMFWKSLRWMLDPESPLYIQPRLDPGLARWLAGFLLATRRSRFERGAEALLHLCRFSVDRWEELSRQGDDFGFARHGLACVYETAKGMDAGKAYAALVGRQGGIRHELWTAAEVREREPAVVGAQVGAIFYPDDAHCEPYRAMTALAAAAVEAGALIFEDTEVFGIPEEGGKVPICTTRGNLAAKEVVIAAGAWCGELGKLLGRRVPILGAKGYSLLVPRLRHHPTRSLYLTERKVAINPQRDALRIAGTLELVVGNDLSINPRRVQAILKGRPRHARPAAAAGDPRVVEGPPALHPRRHAPARPRPRPRQRLAGDRPPDDRAQDRHRLRSASCRADDRRQTPTFDPQPFRADRY